MKGFFENYYEGVCFQYWISEKNYCYVQSEKMHKPKRISEGSYQSAYEIHYDL